jgi:hypothetical protein
MKELICLLIGHEWIWRRRVESTGFDVWVRCARCRIYTTRYRINLGVGTKIAEGFGKYGGTDDD